MNIADQSRPDQEEVTQDEYEVWWGANVTVQKPRASTASTLTPTGLKPVGQQACHPCHQRRKYNTNLPRTDIVPRFDVYVKPEDRLEGGGERPIDLGSMRYEKHN